MEQLNEQLNTLKVLIENLDNERLAIVDLIENNEQTEESIFYKQAEEKFKIFTVNIDSITKVKKNIENLIKDKYNESETKYKADKRKLLELQLKKIELELKNMS